MITFILFAVVILGLCLAILMRPLLRKQNTQALPRDAQNIHFAKTRLAELENQLANSSISKQSYDALKLEIETTLLHDIDLSNQTRNDTSQNNKESNGVVITLLCTLIPFAALVIYQLTGTPGALNQNTTAANPQAIEKQNVDAQGINEMVLAIEQRLQKDPDDLQGWTILARTYLALERYQDAINANLSLLKLSGESAAIYTQLADSSALLAGGMIAGQPSAYIKKALAIDPQYPQALWLAGLGAAQNGNTQQASDYWNTLLPLLNNSPQQQQELKDIIAQTMGETINQTSNQGIIESPAEQAIGGATPLENESYSEQGLVVSVSISEAVQALPNDSVFVFASAQNGPPAPLAVKRLTVADLPIQIQLNDSDAMIDQFKLSLFENVIITARLSKSGNPIAQPGDIQSKPVSSKNNNKETITLFISEQVQD